MDTKAIVYYSDIGEINRNLLYNCYMQLVEAAGSIPLYCVIQEPVDFMLFSHNTIVADLPQSGLSLMKQIVTGCQAASSAKWVFTAEHDVLYPRGYFDFTPEKEDIFYYNNNNFVYTDRLLLTRAMSPLSQLCCGRKALISAMNRRIYKEEKMGIKTRCYEPGKGGDFLTSVEYKNHPIIDIRHEHNFTGGSDPRRCGSPVNYVDRWGTHAEIKERIYQNV